MQKVDMVLNAAEKVTNLLDQLEKQTGITRQDAGGNARKTFVMHSFTSAKDPASRLPKAQPQLQSVYQPSPQAYQRQPQMQWVALLKPQPVMQPSVTYRRPIAKVSPLPQPQPVAPIARQQKLFARQTILDIFSGTQTFTPNVDASGFHPMPFRRNSHLMMLDALGDQEVDLTKVKL